MNFFKPENVPGWALFRGLLIPERILDVVECEALVQQNAAAVGEADLQAEVIRKCIADALLAAVLHTSECADLDDHIRRLSDRAAQHIGSLHEPVALMAVKARVISIVLTGADAISQDGKSSISRAVACLQQFLDDPRFSERSPYLDSLVRQLLCDLGSPQVACEGGIRVLHHPVTGDEEWKKYNALHRGVPVAQMPDVGKLKSDLDAEFPWLAQVTELLTRELHLLAYYGQKEFRFRPWLLAGPPGVGKTRYARRLAEIAHVPFLRIPCGGSTDNRALAGTSRGWTSAHPGLVIQFIHQSRWANPLIMLDELDKVSPSRHNGRIWDVCLQLTERETAARHYDECLEQECDLSWVSWIATVNEIGPLPIALRERFNIVYAPLPTAEHFPVLLSGVLADIAHELRLPDVRLLPEISYSERESLLAHCGLNPRRLAESVRAMLRHKVLQLPACLH